MPRFPNTTNCFGTAAAEVEPVQPRRSLVCYPFAARSTSGYAWAVRRYAYRKWVVLIALMCQVLSATLIHVPSANASTPAKQPAAVHCPDHEHMNSSGDSVANDPSQAVGGHGHAAGGPEHDSTPGHPCKAGHCKCPCAQSSAMAIDSVTASSPPPHLPITFVYVPPPVPERSTPFFRPPI